MAEVLPQRFEFMGALSRLLEDPRSLSAHELGTLSHVIKAATASPDAAVAGDVSATAAAILAVMDAGADVQEMEAEFGSVLVMQEMQRRVDAAHVGPGRGYSEWERAPDRIFTPVDRVAQYRVHPERFRKKFSLLPEEFDLLFNRVHAALQNLPRRKLDQRNRLAMALRYMRTGHNQEEIGEWFGCGHSCANDDIDDVVAVIFNDPATTAEISWPTQAAGDDIVKKVAAWRPNLSGALVTGDAKKRGTNVRGRTYDTDLHKLDYDSNKGHGRQFFLCCEIPTGRMCYLDSNFGGRGESYCYQEYDVCQQLQQQYWSRTLLDADPNIGRDQAQYVSWTGIGDAMYTFAVHNGLGAAIWYHPKHDDARNKELNRSAEIARSCVEHQFGRIGKMWKVASDDAGPWHHVGNGGHYREGSDWGMEKSVMYYTVCARLTAMTQRMRGTYPRQPDEFFRDEFTEEELSMALARIAAARTRRAMPAI